MERAEICDKRVVESAPMVITRADGPGTPGAGGSLSFPQEVESANTIARKKLYEMNATISDTAEYGCYLFDHACKPLLADFMKGIDADVIGKKFGEGSDNSVDNRLLIEVNEEIRFHPVEIIGYELRESMTAMTKIV